MDMAQGRQIVAALVRHARIGIQRDIRDGRRVAHQELAPRQVRIHQRRRLHALAPPLPHGRIIHPGRAAQMDQQARLCKGMHVLRLLETQPAAHLCLRQPLIGQPARALPQVPQNRLRFGQPQPLGRQQRRHLAPRIDGGKGLRLQIALHDIEGPATQRQPHVAAGQSGSSRHCPNAACRPAPAAAPRADVQACSFQSSRKHGAPPTTQKADIGKVDIGMKQSSSSGAARIRLRRSAAAP